MKKSGNQCQGKILLLRDPEKSCQWSLKWEKVSLTPSTNLLYLIDFVLPAVIKAKRVKCLSINLEADLFLTSLALSQNQKKVTVELNELVLVFLVAAAPRESIRIHLALTKKIARKVVAVNPINKPYRMLQ